MGPRLCVLLFLAGCASAPPTGGIDRDDGDSDASSNELGVCFSQGDCDAGLECVALGATSHCLRPCAAPTDCGAASDCGEDGYCRRAVPYYGECGRLDACGADALCDSLAPTAPSRCVPICDVGDLVGKTAVGECPTVPAAVALTGAVQCRAGARPGTSASLCVADVALGEPCDELALRCDPDGDRADTDPSAEALQSLGPDPGAPRCLPVGAATVCARVCTLDGGGAVSPCACPDSDALCADPSDPGVSWACVHWSDLATGLGACVAHEPCAGDPACADNMETGLTACLPSPFTDDVPMVCGPPADGVAAAPP